MKHLSSCEFNMSTICAELQFLDSNLTTIAVENVVADNIYQWSELDYLIYKDSIAYEDLVLEGNPESYLKIVMEYKPLD